MTREEIINIIKYNLRFPAKGDSFDLLKKLSDENNHFQGEGEQETLHSALLEALLNEIEINGQAMSDKEDDAAWAAQLDKINGVDNSKEQEKELVKTFVKDKTKGTYDLAVYLCKKYSMITVGNKQRETYVYQNGYYIRAENEIIYPEIQRILKDKITKNAKAETMHKIQDHTSFRREIFENTDPRFIPLSNGVYDVTTKRLLQHDPKYHFKYQIPVIYNPEATCLKIEAFFDQVFTQTQRTTIEEWIGYSFYRNYMYKKAMIIVGEGDTGKTTFLELLAKLIGENNRSGISLHKITSDKFSSAQLYEKHINIFDELSDSDVDDTANFKIATGGGTIMGEYKFGDQFAFKNFAKLLFACNKIPDVKSVDDEAYFNRWMVIHLEKTIEKKISNFINTLTTQEEISGLFNLAMRALDRLLEQDGFSYKYSGIDTKLEMMRSSSSIAGFISEAIYKDVGNEVTKEKMYEAYLDYCEEKNLSPETMIMLGKKIGFYAPYINEGKIYGMFDGKVGQVRGWRNVNIRLSDEETLRLQKDKEDVESWTQTTSDLIKQHSNIVIKAS